MGRSGRGERDGKEWEKNVCRNLAGASKGTPGDAKYVKGILGGQK